MSASNSNALVKRSAADALMPPPPAPKRIKRPSVVLDEDTYTSAISHIIRRDFFPGLAETDAQREYLNAVDSKDRTWIREAGKKLTQVMTPVPHSKKTVAERTRFENRQSLTGRTPSVWGTDTPVSVQGSVVQCDEEGLGKLDKVDLDLSLSAFQAKYTSEDQESFSQIIDKQNKARYDKNSWVREGNMYASKQRIAQQKVIEARPAAPTSQAVILRPSQNLDDRPAAPNTHRHAAFNNLMFVPDGVEGRTSSRIHEAEQASSAPPKQVRYENTRLPPVSENEKKGPPSPTLSAVRDAVAGRPRLTASEGGYTGSETPRVNGYAFVDARGPEPEDEEEDDDDDDAPTDLLKRYGLDHNSGVTPFRLNESSAREKLLHRMVDQISAKRSNPHAKPAATGSGLGIFTSETPRFLSAPTPHRLQGGQTPGRKNKGDLTPAAQRLFERVGGATPKRQTSSGFGKSGLGQEWTTPRSRIQKK